MEGSQQSSLAIQNSRVVQQIGQVLPVGVAGALGDAQLHHQQRRIGMISHYADILPHHHHLPLQNLTLLEVNHRHDHQIVQNQQKAQISVEATQRRETART